MKLNHLDLPVSNPIKAADFFINYLGFKRIFTREDGLVVLIGDGDFALSLSPLQGGKIHEYPFGFHIGFNISDEIKFEKICNTLSINNIDIASPMGELGGAQTMQFYGPDNIIIEFAHRL